MLKAERHPLDEAPATIGRYRILSRLGDGGMGVVYAALQTEPFRRRVAIKVIRGELNSREFAARFESERQALAMMDHPSIARVFDAGTDERGRSYIVMECIDGVPITQHCDSESLSLRQRLELFIRVCNAVQHAHMKAVIHRDIKPTNVLVTIRDGQPVPKVIDFGVAKAIDGPLASSSFFTRFGQFVGTPGYMSPEVAEFAEDIDTRTDVYSLGVLLYELLVGVIPFETKGSPPALGELLRRIREDEPLAPSRHLTALGEEGHAIARCRRTSRDTLRRELAGELDRIALKALDKDRERRYPTALWLALDVRRYLDDEPVTASPPSRTYRLAKMFRSNRLFFASGMAGAGVLLLSTLFSTAMYIESNRAQHDAELRFDLAMSAVRSYQVAIGNASLSKEEGDVRAMEQRLLHAADRLYGEIAATPAVDGISDRHVAALAAAYQELGASQLRLGSWNEAERAFRSAVELRKTLLRRDPRVPRLSLELAEAKRLLSSVLVLQKKSAEADRLLHAASNLDGY
jgi:eukaryotic-like serine/threonine-protein kinase